MRCFLFLLVSLMLVACGHSAVAQCYVVEYEDCEDWVDEDQGCEQTECEDVYGYFGERYRCPENTVGIEVWYNDFQFPNDILSTSNPNVGRDDWQSKQSPSSGVYCALIYDCDTLSGCYQIDGLVCQNGTQSNYIYMSDIELVGALCDSGGPL
ncbi:hypothetical protein [Crateriforma conspicua]|uniref:Uncharacterized protein n=1 Tax=Crateriforma conspicua TaxID=2527996 RepID=A0A5C5Y7Z7_9PLAN|nr:hypothetical protein [Crateriforma conspicua]QDV65907.1 hypothetical protein Mal65_50800 [Crateriforma conspicua]TWT71304.1 hypothetical protein Pan14r_36140 [Crateriforma conspicua]